MTGDNTGEGFQRRCFLPPKQTWEMGCGAQFMEGGVRKRKFFERIKVYVCTLLFQNILT